MPARLRLWDARGNHVVPLGHPGSLAADAQEGDVSFQSRRFAYVSGEFAIDPAWLPLKNGEGTLLSSLYGTRRPEAVFAHSSPVYLIRDCKPIRSRDDAQYSIRYLGNAIQWLKTGARFADSSDKRASIEAFERGRVVYAKLARESGRS